jgi:glycosyltransferase involved in cell wall biosynthesis
MLIRAVSELAGVDLVFLGGDRWSYRKELAVVASRGGVADRVHFVDDVPSARRAEYLAEADIGLALTSGRYPEGRLPAADVFDMLGIPYIASGDECDFRPESRIASNAEPETLRAAILMASERQRLPAREDGARILADLFIDLANVAPLRDPSRPERSPQTMDKPATEPDEEAGATALLKRAKLLRDRGERQGAIGLYLQVSEGAYSPEAVATAAAALARLNARVEAREAIKGLMALAQRSSLATVRVGEAAALLGDLPRARACVDEALAAPSAPTSALRSAIRVLEQSGEPRAALRIARRAGDELSIARIEGALTSYDPTWLPVGAAGGRTPVRPRAGRFLTLLETSLPHVRSGYTYRAQTLLRAQQHVGIEPAVLTRLGFPATRGISTPPREEVDGVIHYRARLPDVKRYTSVPVSEQLEENVRWAAALGREIRPEAVVATTPHLNGLVGLALRSELGVPVVYDVRGFPEMTWAVREGGGKADVFGLRRVAETRCMREADLVTTLSATMRDHIVSRGIPPEKIHILPHAVDTAAFAPAECDRELAAKLGLAGRPVVGYISSLVSYEGVEILLDAIALARRNEPTIAGLVVGSGELLPSLEAQTKRLKLDGHVVFTGRVDGDQVARYYSLTDIFVCPRRDHEVTRYVTPLKPFEAMAAGCCIVLSDLPTLREAVRDGECGALFPSGDAEALATTILDLLDRPQRRRELMEAAREHAVANHSFEILCGRLERVWEELRVRSAASQADAPSASVLPVQSP